MRGNSRKPHMRVHLPQRQKACHNFRTRFVNENGASYSAFSHTAKPKILSVWLGWENSWDLHIKHFHRCKICLSLLMANNMLGWIHASSRATLAMTGALPLVYHWGEFPACHPEYWARSKLITCVETSRGFDSILIAGRRLMKLGNTF